MENDKLVEVSISQEYLQDLADFIEKELNPPSKLRYLVYYFIFGILGGLGFGVFIAFMWVKP
jgi:hypothetical protein